MINIDEIPKIGGVYKIISPSNKVYIGRTKNLKNRFLKYSRLLCEKQHKLYNSFKKYGFYKHNLEILEFTNDNNLLNELEIKYIKLFNTYFGENGLNLTEGGCGMKKKHSVETKIKISEGLKNSVKFNKTMKSEEYKNKLSKSLVGHPGYGKGMKRSEEIIKKIKKSVNDNIKLNGTRKHTNESKLKMSKNRKGGGNNNAKKCTILYHGKLYEFDCKKSLKPFLKKINDELELKGPKRYSWDGLFNRGYTNDIQLILKEERSFV